jgi:hypothetical protein
MLLSFFIFNGAISWVQACGGVLIGIALWLVNREMPARNARERMNEALTEGEV